MSSLLTNTSAMTALQTLSMTNKNLAQSQNRIATGMRVSEASDNAAYWSIATTMRSDNKALGAVQDALGLGAATLDTMYTGMNGTVDVLSDIKAKLVAARTPGVDRGKIQSEIAQLQKQLKSTADSSVSNGENWISVDSASAGYNATKTVVSSFSRASGVVTVETVAVPVDSIKLYDKRADATPATTVSLATTTGTFSSATAGTVSLAVAGSPAVVVGISAGATLDDVVTSIKAANIEGLYVQKTDIGQISIAWRGKAALTVTITGLGITGPAAIAAPTTATVKGILDKSYDIYNDDGAAYAAAKWSTFSIANLDISKLTDSTRDLNKFSTYIAGVDKALEAVTDAATSLGAIKNRVNLQQNFVKALKDSLDRGIGQLVDADMNAESTRLQALQTQQQLGIQALSIANSGSENILSLFR